MGCSLGLVVAVSICVNEQGGGLVSMLIKHVGDTKLRGAASLVSDSFKL